MDTLNLSSKARVVPLSLSFSFQNRSFIFFFLYSSFFTSPLSLLLLPSIHTTIFFTKTTFLLFFFPFSYSLLRFLLPSHLDLSSNPRPNLELINLDAPLLKSQNQYRILIWGEISFGVS
jgi:hypothetical protein